MIRLQRRLWVPSSVDAWYARLGFCVGAEA